MSTPLDALVAERDSLFASINEHYFIILEISRWLSPPILETLTPQQIDYYQEQLLFYMERIDAFIGQLVAVIATLASLGYTDLNREILDQIDDMLFVLNKIIGELPGEVDDAIETPIIDVGGSMTQIRVDLNAELEITLKEDQGFWEKLMANVGDVITAPLDWLLELGEDFTLGLMELMFTRVFDHALDGVTKAIPGTIDKVGDKLSSGVAHALGVEEEFK